MYCEFIFLVGIPFKKGCRCIDQNVKNIYEKVAIFYYKISRRFSCPEIYFV